MKHRLILYGLAEDTPNRLHRGDFITCPECSFEQDSAKWTKSAHTLVLRPVSYRAGAVVLITECPKCKISSWTHSPINSIELYDAAFPFQWQTEARLLEKDLNAVAEEKWKHSLCRTCKLLESHTTEYHDWRNCTKGCGPSCSKCPYYEKGQRKKR